MNNPVHESRFNLIDVLKNFSFLLIIIGIPLVSYLVTLQLPSPLNRLFIYSLFSIGRIAAAYVLSLLFAVSMGFAAAFNPKFEKVLLPTLDVLQSVPVVGFFPVAIAVFVSLFHGERIGIELAAIFLIFTSQAWNMAFGVYESLITIPKDLRRLSSSIGLKGWLAFKRLYFPACIPSLTYNSMVSWANSWFFLMSSEIFAIGAKEFKLPGIGYLLWLSSEKGNLHLTLLTLIALFLIIYVLHKIFFEPLSDWSKKFSYQMVPEGETSQYSVVLSKMKDLSLFLGLNKVFKFVKKAMHSFEEHILEFLKLIPKLPKPEKNLMRWVNFIFLVILFFFLVLFFLVNRSFFLNLSSEPFPWHFLGLSILATFVSFLRISIVCLICVLITYLFATYLAINEKAYRKLNPFLQMTASLPGTALYPFLLALVLKNKLPFGLELTALLVIFSTSFWYILFPVLGLMRNIPREIKESVTALTKSRAFLAKKILIPGSFPALVTGLLAAWGASWNALVISEYGVFKGKTYSVFGIGALLDKANYQYGDPLKIAITLFVMVLTIIFFNRLVWQKLYRFAAKRFSLEIE